MPTIKDIAREAGVSHGTVSNVLNKTGKVSVEKIRLVEEAAKRLGYVPNVQAQMLRQGAPTSIMVMVPSLKEDKYLDLFTTIQNTMLTYHYDTAVYTTDDISGNEEKLLERVRVANCAAVITVSCLSEGCCDFYASMPCPVIFVDRRPPVLRAQDSFVSFDYDRIEEDLFRVLCTSGCRSIAFFTAPDFSVQASQMIAQLYNRCMRRGMNAQIFTSDYTLALNKSFDIMQSADAFDAIVTSSAARSATLQTVIHLLKPPHPPRIFTLGSIRSCHMAQTSTYILDYNLMAAEICRHLVRNLQEKEPLPSELIFRGSGFPFHFDQLQRMDREQITMLTLDNPSSSALRKLLPLFESATGIRLKLVCIPYEDLHRQILFLNENFYYDLIRMDVPHFDSIGKNTYLPLDEVGFDDHGLVETLIRNGFRNYSMLDDSLYALPFDPSVQIYLYRKDLFSDATLSRAYYERYHEALEVPKTVEQHLRIAEFFTRKYNPDSPTEFGATTTIGSASCIASDFLPYFLAKSVPLYDRDHHITIDTPEMVDAMEEYLRLAGFACNEQWWQGSTQNFADGRAATTIVYSNYASAVINTKHSSVVGKVGAAVVPGGKPLLGGGVIGISRYSKKAEACRQFFKWYYSHDIASMLVRLGGTSPMLDPRKDIANFSLFPWLSTSRRSFSLGTRGLQTPELSDFSTQRYEFSLGSTLLNLTSGIITPRQAAQMAQAMYDNDSNTSRSSTTTVNRIVPPLRNP